MGSVSIQANIVTLSIDTIYRYIDGKVSIFESIDTISPSLAWTLFTSGERENQHSSSMLANRLRWKGKLVTEKQYNHRIRLSESNKKRRRSVTENKDERNCNISGRRIVNLKVMAQHMNCTSCKAVLSIQNVEKETRRGLASIFLVRCRDCLLVNIVPTDNLHAGLGNRNLFMVNSDAVTGMMRAGVGYSAFDRLLQTMEIPNMSQGTFQRYQQNKTSMMPKLQTASCEGASPTEKSMEVNNPESFESILAENIQTGLPVLQDTDQSVSLAASMTTQQFPVTEASPLLTLET